MHRKCIENAQTFPQRPVPPLLPPFLSPYKNLCRVHAKTTKTIPQLAKLVKLSPTSKTSKTSKTTQVRARLTCIVRCPFHPSPALFYGRKKYKSIAKRRTKEHGGGFKDA